MFKKVKKCVRLPLREKLFGGKYYMGNPKTGEPAKEQPKSKEKDKDVKVKNKNVQDFENRIEKKWVVYLQNKKILTKNSMDKINTLYEQKHSEQQKE